MASSGVVPSQLPPCNSNPLVTVLPLQVFPSVRPQPSLELQVPKVQSLSAPFSPDLYPTPHLSPSLSRASPLILDPSLLAE